MPIKKTRPKYVILKRPHNRDDSNPENIWLLMSGGQQAAPTVAYVETTGNDATAELQNPLLPFATINAALDALPVGGGSVKIGVGTFAEITCDNNGANWPIPTATSKIKDNVKFYGSGKPALNAGKTGLLGGTIIKGPLGLDHNGIELHDLGVDSGSDFCTADHGGTAQEGLVMANMGQVSPATKLPRTGIVVRNVSAICKAAVSAVHCALFENMDGPVIDNLTTCYGFAGAVIKTHNGTVSNLNLNSHGTGGLYVKSNAYAACHDNNISDVAITGSTGVLFVIEDASSPTMYNNLVTNVVTTSTSFGAKYYNIIAANIDNCDVVNLTGVTTVQKAGTQQARIINCEVNGTAV